RVLFRSWFAHGLADQRRGTEVQHRVIAMAGEGPLQGGRIQQVGLDQFAPAHRLAVASGEVVQHGDLVAMRGKPLRHVAADVAGAAADQVVHRRVPWSYGWPAAASASRTCRTAGRHDGMRTPKSRLRAVVSRQEYEGRRAGVVNSAVVTACTRGARGSRPTATASAKIASAKPCQLVWPS